MSEAPLSARSLCALVLAALILILPAMGAADPATAPDSSSADSTAKDTPWNVEDEHGPSQTISFTTDEGTWLSLDVHPDGKQIVFSLLGDLYLMPVSGGKARRITSGSAYDSARSRRGCSPTSRCSTGTRSRTSTTPTRCRSS
jgi:hypothetical protein